MGTTLTQLIERSKRRADLYGSSFIADAEWTVYVNEGLSELWDLVIGKHEDYALTSDTISLVVGTDTYNLPSDFYKMRGVDVVEGGLSYTLTPFSFADRNKLQDGLGGILYLNQYQYAIVGVQIKFIPVPSASSTVKVWYVPEVTELANGSDEVSSAFPPGWDRYVSIYAAIQAKQKQQVDASLLMAQIQMAERKILRAAGNRDSGEPMQVVDVRWRHRGQRW